jgi:hypothetical protein
VISTAAEMYFPETGSLEGPIPVIAPAVVDDRISAPLMTGSGSQATDSATEASEEIAPVEVLIVAVKLHDGEPTIPG